MDRKGKRKLEGSATAPKKKADEKAFKTFTKLSLARDDIITGKFKKPENLKGILRYASRIYAAPDSGYFVKFYAEKLIVSIVEKAMEYGYGVASWLGEITALTKEDVAKFMSPNSVNTTSGDGEIAFAEDSSTTPTPKSILGKRKSSNRRVSISDQEKVFVNGLPKLYDIGKKDEMKEQWQNVIRESFEKEFGRVHYVAAHFRFKRPGWAEVRFYKLDSAKKAIEKGSHRCGRQRLLIRNWEDGQKMMEEGSPLRSPPTGKRVSIGSRKTTTQIVLRSSQQATTKEDTDASRITRSKSKAR